MTPRRQRMLAVGLAAAGLVIATVLTLRSFEDNMMFFVSPTEVMAGEYPEDRTFRIGGLVVDGSVQREPESLEVASCVNRRPAMSRITASCANHQSQPRVPATPDSLDWPKGNDSPEFWSRTLLPDCGSPTSR